MGVPEYARLRSERAVSCDLQEELFVSSKRQARGGVPPRVELKRKLNGAFSQHSRRDREDRSTCASGANRRRQNHITRVQFNRLDRGRETQVDRAREAGGDERAVPGWRPPVAAGGRSPISEVVGDRDALQTGAREEAAHGLEIGAPLALWL